MVPRRDDFVRRSTAGIAGALRFGLVRACASLGVLAGLQGLPASSLDVTGYSIIKGHFLNQTGPDELVLDPLFGFSVLGGVDLADLDLLDTASVRLPEGETLELDDYGDSWSLLYSYETQAELDAAYQWGDYIVSFESRTEGSHACLLELPETPLPPTPRLVTFEATQAIDPAKPLTLTWAFDGALAKDDFVQLYVTLGHGEVFSTPNLGEPGALTIEDRTVTIPADTLEPGYIHSLNLEVTRITSTNADCYPGVQGVAAVFRSTSVDLFPLTPPTLRFLARPAMGLPEIEVVTDPEGTVVLQGTSDLWNWSNLETNAAASGTNVFTLPGGSEGFRFFRALVR